MTCRGYDPKAVKVPKSVKALYSIADKNKRRALIKSHVKILEGELRSAGGKK